MFRRFVLPVLVFASLFGVEASQAAGVRLPVTGSPAYEFDAPAGWDVNYDQYGNLTFAATDKSCALELSMITDPVVATTPASTVATNVMTAAGAAPYSKTGPGMIAGLPGDAFYSEIVYPNGKHIGFRLDVVKLDSTHDATMGTLTTAGMTAEQTAALNALIADVRLSGLK